MSSQDKLIELVKSYHGGLYSRGAAQRVERWFELFPQGTRQQVSDELAHVLGTAFLTRDESRALARQWLVTPSESSRGLLKDWSESTFLRVQSGGGSQADVLQILSEEAKASGVEDPTIAAGTKVHVYVDDVSVQGMRILNDLTPWIEGAAPAQAELLVLLQRRWGHREGWVTRELKGRAQRCGKTLRVTWSCSLDFGQFDCYFPRMLPDDPRMDDYVARVSPKIDRRSANGSGRYFSTESARTHLEQALLLAGIDVLSENGYLSAKKHMRPLGNTVLPWLGLGIGVPIVTWRNCPNSAPLALWAEGGVPPLFPRDAN
jgi:hypothetical protein